MKIPRDVRKSDLYDYVETLCSKKIRMLHEKTQEKLNTLSLDEHIYLEVSDEISEFSDIVKNFVAAVDNTNERIVDIFKARVYNRNFFERFIYQMKDNFDFEDAQKKHLRSKFRKTEFYGIKGMPIYDSEESDHPTLREAKKIFNEVAHDHNEELAKIRKLKVGLNDIIKKANRGSNAWKLLEEAGLNMSDLRMSLSKQEKTNVPEVITNFDINLLEGVSIFDEDKDDEKDLGGGAIHEM
jgi:hypothetical protein